MSQYVIGVDAGATKTQLAIFTTEGEKKDLCAWGPLNHEVLPGSFAQLEDELGRFIQASLQTNGIAREEVRYSVFGLAGADTTGQHKIISDIIRRLGFAEFTLINDGFLGIPAGSRSGVGICAINGTGESIFGLNSRGRTFQIGGVGYISSDMGGGGMLGQRVVSSVYRELFRLGQSTALTPMLFAELGIADKYDFVETIYRKMEEKTYKVGSLNRLLFEAAQQGDKVAVQHMRDIAENYAGGIACMAMELAFPEEQPLDIVLAGSVFVKGEQPILRELVRTCVARHLPGRELRFTLFEKPPVAGAIVWALSCVNGAGDYLDRVSAQL